MDIHFSINLNFIFTSLIVGIEFLLLKCSLKLLRDKGKNCIHFVPC